MRTRNLLLLAGISALLALGLEGGTRLVLRITTGVWPTTEATRFDREIRTALGLYRRHPFLNTAPAEGASAFAFGKSASFNSLGYRSPERPLIKPAATQRVLCAGGSTTFDILAPDDAATWPQRLEFLLRERLPKVEVWNAGFPGWTSLENTVSLALRDIDLEPDVVVLFQGINDLQPASHHPFDRQYEAGHSAESVRALGFELRPLPWYGRSVLVERLRNVTLGSSSPFDPLLRASEAGPKLNELPHEALATFERNIRSFISIAHTRGAHVLLVTQPLRIRRLSLETDRSYLAQWIVGLDPNAAPVQLERLNAILRRLAAEVDADLADAAAEIDWSDEDFSDPMHFSERGSQRFSEYLAGKITAILGESS